jgi:hypothetical protein
MDALDEIRAKISDFGGYVDAALRRISDEQIRAFAGEALAALPSPRIDGLEAEERLSYDRALLRCEFLSREAFQAFDADPTAERIRAILEADLEILDAAAALRQTVEGQLASTLARLHDAFERRDAAMLSQ